MASPEFPTDDLLDLSNAGDFMPNSLLSGNSPSGDEISVSGANGSGSSVAAGLLSGGLPVPSDDLAELDWLTNLEEHLLSDDLDLDLITGPGPDPKMVPQPEPANMPSGKRAHGPKTGPITIHEPKIPGPVDAPSREWARPDPKDESQRRCSHCSVEKTPQWRTGPKGPKTLCNACGVRYKTGRLVPEYRPAASPTFVRNKHSNSHKKVLELRKQKARERMLVRHQQFGGTGPVAGPTGGFLGRGVNFGG